MPDSLAEKFINIFSILDSWQERNLFESFFVYYFELAPLIKDQKLNLLLDQISNPMITEFISLADRFRLEGRQEGRKEELERKNHAATKKMLQKDADEAFICDVLEVTPAFVEKVRKEMEAQN